VREGENLSCHLVDTALSSVGEAGQEELGRRGCVSVQPHTMQGTFYQLLKLLGSFFLAYLELGMVFASTICSCPQQL